MRVKEQHKKYGDRINYAALPDPYRQEIFIKHWIQTDIYQAQILFRDFAQPRNFDIINKTNSNTVATAGVFLFSGNSELTYAQIIDYYSLQFQIKFNFRDAKQYWGLEDFINVKKNGCGQCRQPFVIYGQRFPATFARFSTQGSNC
jgi:putative transposase